jgi:hypothetical protein
MRVLTWRSLVNNCRRSLTVNRTVREYVEQVERENVVVDPSGSEENAKPELRRTYRNSPPMKISTTDPEEPCPASGELPSLLTTTII